MKQNILLTGKPGSGKTTIIMKVVDFLKNNKTVVGGFYTSEIRENHERIGFRIKTLDGREGLLAGIGLRTGYRIGKYQVDIDAIDNIIVPSIQDSLNRDLIIIDEIGKMELLSEKFRVAVVQAIETRKVLGTITQYDSNFTLKIKGREDVRVITINEDNRNCVVEDIVKEILDK